ncbi:hypothetical protein CRYUN_Cryun02cG0097800 [Craigia yunnanensis]
MVALKMSSLLQCRLKLLFPFHHPYSNSILPCPIPPLLYPRRQTVRILCAKRTGKQRYPSEKKKLKLKQKETLSPVTNKFEGIWRLSKLAVSVQNDPGKDFFQVASMLPEEAFSVVRKSFDARKILKEAKFVYTVDMDVSKLLSLEPRTWDFISRLEPKVGLIEHMPRERINRDLTSIVHDFKDSNGGTLSREQGPNNDPGDSHKCSTARKPKIAVVGSGPSGLFASLVLAEFGADVTLIERGQAVERRGRDIGALAVRRILESESNFCFGEGGAGTWSDGKLVTRIGRNSGCVLAIMNTLVHFGAPKNILADGKPHLGTDRLVPLLRNFRQHLQSLGVDIKFGMRVDDLLIQNGCVVGVQVSDSTNKLQLDCKKLGFDAVILAVGHSARDIYHMLLSHNVDLAPKDFAVGLRVEHPQELINSIQYVSDEDEDSPFKLESTSRNCYSFCMCPGGQVVLTSTSPSEICINGMSFSRRASRWINAALVVTVSAKDFDALNFHGPLAGVEFQTEFERRAAIMGGGNFVVPVQKVTDFMENKVSVTSMPPSSYRLGVKSANLHDLFPNYMTDALRYSISMFDKEVFYIFPIYYSAFQFPCSFDNIQTKLKKLFFFSKFWNFQLPGFISKEALLHGVETRTSSPIQIPCNSDTYESMTLRGLYPVGEGAGYAGGIVSAAVDGMYTGFSVAKEYDLFHGDIESVLGKAQSAGLVKY